ncbi:regulator of cell cycle RGCC [Neosynchiropus ocellatus]
MAFIINFPPLRNFFRVDTEVRGVQHVSMSSVVKADFELELSELLQEFQDVVEELKVPTRSKPHVYQHVLKEAKSRALLGDDSGLEDSDYSSEASMGNSLNASEEELHTAGLTQSSKAKLGDTRELESFIDMLDRELAGANVNGEMKPGREESGPEAAPSSCCQGDLHRN